MCFTYVLLFVNMSNTKSANKPKMPFFLLNFVVTGGGGYGKFYTPHNHTIVSINNPSYVVIGCLLAKVA